jgi:hypothetical protein
MGWFDAVLGQVSWCTVLAAAGYNFRLLVAWLEIILRVLWIDSSHESSGTWCQLIVA